MSSIIGYADFNEEENIVLADEGTYKLKIVKCALVDTKKNDGKMIKIVYSIIDDEKNYPLIFSIFNVENQSIKAQNIGRAALSKLKFAIGAPNAGTVQDLIGGVFEGRVVVRKGSPKKNSIGGVEIDRDGVVVCYPDANDVTDFHVLKSKNEEYQKEQIEASASIYQDDVPF